MMPATVVGGSSSAHNLTSLHRGAGDALSMAVLSVRPDGARLHLLSLVVAMRYDTARAARKALEAMLSRPPPSRDAATPSGARRILQAFG